MDMCKQYPVSKAQLEGIKSIIKELKIQRIQNLRAIKNFVISFNSYFIPHKVCFFNYPLNSLYYLLIHPHHINKIQI